MKRLVSLIVVLALGSSAPAYGGWAWSHANQLGDDGGPGYEPGADVLHTVTFDRESGRLFHFDRNHHTARIRHTGIYLIGFQAAVIAGLAEPALKNQAVLWRNGNPDAGGVPVAFSTFGEFSHDDLGTNLLTIRHLRRGDRLHVVVRIDTDRPQWLMYGSSTGFPPLFSIIRLR
jgi:hypothetical protein